MGPYLMTFWDSFWPNLWANSVAALLGVAAGLPIAQRQTAGRMDRHCCSEPDATPVKRSPRRSAQRRPARRKGDLFALAR
jgi:hypothetical protein